MTRMRKIGVPFVVLLCAFAFSSCNKGRYERNNAAGSAWLDSYSHGAGISVNGSWLSADWGSATFSQNGRRVTGTLGNYAVEGVVSGGKVYLLIASNGWIHYTAVVEKTEDGVLSGFYSSSVPYRSLDQQDLVLKRW